MKFFKEKLNRLIEFYQYKKKIHDNIFNKEKVYKEIEKHYEFLNKSEETNYKEITLVENTSDLKVSVVTAVYNGEKYINDAFRSLENQTISKNIEWIIVDDNSTDNTVELVKKLSKNNTKLGCIKLIKLRENRGTSFSFSLGVSKTRSDVIAWHDVDDFYLSHNKLERDYYLINDQKYDISCSIYMKRGYVVNEFINSVSILDIINRWILVKNYNNIELLDKFSLNINLFLSFLFFLNIFNTIRTSFSKRKYFEVGGVDNKLSNIPQDFDLFLKMFLGKSRVKFNEDVVFYRISPNQVSKNLLSTNIGRAFIVIRLLEAIKKKDQIFFYEIINNLFLFFLELKKKLYLKCKIFGYDYLLFNLRDRILFLYYLLYLFQKEEIDKNYLKKEVLIEVNKEFFRDGFFSYLEKNIGQDVLVEVINLANLYSNSPPFKEFFNAFLKSR